jgi:hypothetical protein
MCRRGRTRIILVLGLLAAGCSSSQSTSPTNMAPAELRPVAPKLISAPLPGAESLAPNLLMTPVARDGQGCVEYRMQSDSLPNLEAVFYRTNAGDFSTIQEEAACT